MATQSIVGDKSLAFGKRIAMCYRHLNDKKKETIMSKQLLRSGTSIGANVREGLYAQSRKDFISKLNIALKEAGEVMWQREQNEACFDYAESRQSSTIVKPIIGLILFTVLNTSLMKNLSH